MLFSATFRLLRLTSVKGLGAWNENPELLHRFYAPLGKEMATEVALNPRQFRGSEKGNFIDDCRLAGEMNRPGLFTFSECRQPWKNASVLL